MHSIRTNINYHSRDVFKIFCKDNGLESLKIGNYLLQYDSPARTDMLCYAYSDSDADLCEALTVLTLKYGSIENAFKSYLNEQYGALV